MNGEIKTSGVGAFSGVIIGGVLGLPFSAVGLLIGGIIGAILGEIIEYNNIKKREDRKVKI